MSDFWLIIFPLLAGFILDLVIGDPYKLPHPIRLFGNAIYFLEKHFNQGKRQKHKGAFITMILVTSTYFVFAVIIQLSQLNEILYLIIASIFVFYGLANRSLIQEALKVEKELTIKGVNAGRKQLSFIVGRDTSNLNPNQIRTAVLETLSENLSDGVIAPLFYYAIGGVPLMLAYKMINTLDSMIGYKSERYKNFGFFAAKLDDVVNYIPARLTAFLMFLVSFNSRSLKFIFKYGNKHASPNAGYPEAALAGILNCQFGGPNVYHGKLMNKPFIGENARSVHSKDIKKACIINLVGSFLFLGTIVFIHYTFIC